MSIKEEWAKFIMGQALTEIKRKEDIPRVVQKVKETALGTRPDLMKVFLDLVELKRKTLKK
jgi:hypothetical protein